MPMVPVRTRRATARPRVGSVVQTGAPRPDSGAVAVDSGEDRRLDEPAFGLLLGTTAADDQTGAFALAFGDVALDAGAVGLGRHGADLGGGVEGVAHGEGAGEGGEHVDDVVVAGAGGQHAGAEVTGLAVVHEGGG